MTGTTNPHPRPEAHIKAERVESEKRTAQLVAEEREARRGEAERAAKEDEKQRQDAEATAILNKKRDAPLYAPVPKNLAGFAGLAATVQAAIDEYRTRATALGVPHWAQNAVIQQHPIMPLMPWLASFGSGVSRNG